MKKQTFVPNIKVVVLAIHSYPKMESFLYQKPKSHITDKFNKVQVMLAFSLKVHYTICNKLSSNVIFLTRILFCLKLCKHYNYDRHDCNVS